MRPPEIAEASLPTFVTPTRRLIHPIVALALFAAAVLGVPVPAGAATLAFGPEADARVSEGSPGRNYGASSRLEADRSPLSESYLRFTVTGITGPVSRAALRLYVTNSTPNGPELYPTAAAWSESGVTWSNRPERTGGLLADLGAISSGRYVEFDVTAVVTQNAAYSFSLVADSSDGADFNSKEASSNRPQLVIDMADAPPGPDTTPPETAITSGPSSPSGSPAASFSFSSSEAGSTFACRLDGGSFGPCTSPASYSGLADGAHTFEVRATDPAGNPDPSPAAHGWVVDTSSPPPPTSGVIDTIAGTSSGFSGDGGPATAARLRAPRTMDSAPDGSIFVVDTDNHRVRRIGPDGIITTVAGTGSEGESGDGGPATESQLDSPHGIAVDEAGHVFVADAPNHRIRRIDMQTGIITTAAGTGRSGYNGDGIEATSARLSYPKGVEIGPDGDLFIGDANNHRVRRVDRDTGIITTVAGTGSSGFSGDGGQATSARFNKPRNLAFDSAGNLYVADDLNCRVRRVDAEGRVTTVAGSGSCGDSGDGGPATSARIGRVRDVAVDASGSIYIADEENDRVRRVGPAGDITTFAGTGSSGFGGDGGVSTLARLRAPRGVAVHRDGTILIADTGNHRIRRVS